MSEIKCKKNIEKNKEENIKLKRPNLSVFLAVKDTFK